MVNITGYVIGHNTPGFLPDGDFGPDAEPIRDWDEARDAFTDYVIEFAKDEDESFGQAFGWEDATMEAHVRAILRDDSDSITPPADPADLTDGSFTVILTNNEGSQVAFWLASSVDESDDDGSDVPEGNGFIHAFLTATVITRTDTATDDDYSESNGYVDLSWSSTELAESRNDAGSILSIDERDDDLAERVIDVLSTSPGFPFWDNGDGSFYGHGDGTTVDNGDGTYSDWTYAVHFVRKTVENGQGVEREWHPSVAGIYVSDTAPFVHLHN